MKSYEKIFMTVRRHWVTYVPTVILYVFLAVVPIIIWYFVQQAAPSWSTDPYLRVLLGLAVSAYELAIALFFYANFLIYYLDMLVITNDRLVEVTQGNLFARKISELDLYRIQDTTSNVSGFFATVFDFGRLEVQTASEKEHFVFINIPHPHDLRRSIMQLVETDRKMHAQDKTLLSE